MNRSRAERSSGDPVEMVVGPRLRALGGFTVNRVWPTARRRLIGPFVFFDHLQKAALPPGRGFDVPPHPHIGLATVTYLFEGELLHRDSIGCRQAIRPGELNWMTAGSGIVHSERSPDEARTGHAFIHGIQTWVALPVSREGSAPSFAHYGGEGLPQLEEPGLRLRLIAGSAFGATAAVATESELFYADAGFEAGASCSLDKKLGQRAAYIVDGEVEVGGNMYDAGKLLVFDDARDVCVQARSAARLLVFGGAPLDGERHVWWNFVSSSPDRIEAAKRDWQAGRFAPVPGDEEVMTMPG